MSGNATLYSMVICPFAQRSRIQLALKNIPFELVNLDITIPRPEWFLEINPKGQVPVLKLDDEVICDSSDITFRLHEQENSTLSEEQLQAFATFVEGEFIPALYRLMASRETERIEQMVIAALETWRSLDTLLESYGYESGFIAEKMELPEILIAPFFHRYGVVEYYQGFRLPESEEYDRVRRWKDAILAEDLVQQTAEPMEDLIKMYEDYTLGHFNGSVPPGKQVSSLDLSVPMKKRAMPASLV